MGEVMVSKSLYLPPVPFDVSEPMRMWIWSFFRCNTMHKVLHFQKYSRDLERERPGWLGPCRRLGKGGDWSWTQKLKREAKEGPLRAVSLQSLGWTGLRGPSVKEKPLRVSQGPTRGFTCQHPYASSTWNTHFHSESECLSDSQLLVDIWDPHAFLVRMSWNQNSLLHTLCHWPVAHFFWFIKWKL